MSPAEERPSLRPLALGGAEGMVGGVGGGTGPVVPRRTASQMQRGSGELQSTPTGFWKLQSDPAGAGHGSIAAGIGALGLLRSASLNTNMSQNARRNDRAERERERERMEPRISGVSSVLDPLHRRH